MLERSGIPTATRPERVVFVPSLGGDVLVRSLSLSRSLAFLREFAQLGPRNVPTLLAETVLAGDGQAVYTADEWDAFGVAHIEDALMLYGIARALSGLDEEQTEKKAPSPQ